MPTEGRASSGTCSQVLELVVEANRDTLRRSLLLFPRKGHRCSVGVVQCDVAVNAGLMGVHGVLRVLAGVPSPVDAIPLTVNNLERAHVDVGRPPDDLTGAGALGELCGLRVGYHDDECGPRVPFQPGLAAPPPAGSKAIDTVSCLLVKRVGWLKRGVTLCYVTRKGLDSSGMSWVWSDHSRIPHWYDPQLDTAKFLHQASQAGVITLDRRAEATVCTFFVAKKIENPRHFSIPDVLKCCVENLTTPHFRPPVKETSRTHSACYVVFLGCQIISCCHPSRLALTASVNVTEYQMTPTLQSHLV